MSKNKIAGSLMVAALCVGLVAGCSGDDGGDVDGGLDGGPDFVMALALGGSWEQSCIPTGPGSYNSSRETYSFSNPAEDPKTYTFTVELWNANDCSGTADQTQVFPGTYVLGDESACASGYDSICVDLDILDDAAPAEYTIFSIDVDKAPEELYLPVGGATAGARPSDVETTGLTTVFYKVP